MPCTCLYLIAFIASNAYRLQRLIVTRRARVRPEEAPEMARGRASVGIAQTAAKCYRAMQLRWDQRIGATDIKPVLAHISS